MLNWINRLFFKDKSIESESEDEYQGDFSDCYVLSENRNTKFIIDFLNQFVPNRINTTEGYAIPHYAGNEVITFKKDANLIEYLVENKTVTYSFYWENNKNSEITHAMCFFTNDGKIILGLSTKTKFPNTEIEDNIMKKMKEFISNEYFLITYEEPAPLNSLEFIELIHERNKEKVYKFFLDDKEIGTSKLNM